MQPSVIHSALAGTPWLFSTASAPGMTFSLAGVNTDSAASSVQASRAPPTEIIKPILINTDDALRTCRAFES